MGTTDIEKAVPLALSSTKGRGPAAEPELREYHSIKETQTQKQNSHTSPVQVGVHQPKQSPPLFECQPSPNSSGSKSSAATKRCADDIANNTGSLPKKRKTDPFSITDSEMKEESETVESAVDANNLMAGTGINGTIETVSSNDSATISEHCSHSQPNSTARALKNSAVETCTGSQPVPNLIKMPWRLEIPKRKAAINTSSSTSGLACWECKEKSGLGTQQQPKLLPLPDQATTSDLHPKTLSESNGCASQQQETNENLPQVSTESQRSSSGVNIHVRDSKELSTTMSSTKKYPVTTADSKGPADNSGGASNPSGSDPIVPRLSSDSSETATVSEDCPSRVETAVGCSLQPAPASTTEGEAASFPVLFSEDEEEEDCGGLLSSQMSRTIDRVQLFLKMDRLRRPKPSRAAK